MSTINTTSQPTTSSPFKRHVWTNSTRILKTAGVLALLAAAQWVLLVIVVETQYPNYVIQQISSATLGQPVIVGWCPRLASSSLLRPSSGTARSPCWVCFARQRGPFVCGTQEEGLQHALRPVGSGSVDRGSSPGDASFGA